MRKMAIVLGGGGVKGAYQLGVWKALDALKIEYDLVVGTSIGALNGALMAQNALEEAIEMWNEIDYSNIFAGQKYSGVEKINSRLTMIEHTIKEIVWEGGLDVSPLRSLIDAHLNEQVLRDSPIDFGLVAAQVSNFMEGSKLKHLPSLCCQELMLADIPQDKIAEYLMASSACFPLFKPFLIEEMYYIDGGYCDDLPIHLALQSNPTEILAVDLESIGKRKIIPPQNVQLRYLRCEWDLGPLFCFDKDNISRNIILGYNDCLKEYELLEGGAYTFEKGECSKNYASLYSNAQVFHTLIKGNPNKKIKSFFRYLQAKQLVNDLKTTHKLTPVNLVTRLGEMAGKIFGLPPTVVYTFADFNSQLLEAFYATDYKEEFALEKGNIPKMLAFLSKLDKKKLTIILTKLYMNGDIKNIIWDILNLVPEAMGAAIYISCLMTKEPPREIVSIPQ